MTCIYIRQRIIIKRFFMNQCRFVYFLLSILPITLQGYSPSSNLDSVFNHQRTEIASFIDHVLRQLPSDKVLKIIDTIPEAEINLNDAQWYEKLCDKLAPLRSRTDIIQILKLIRFQKQLLKKQIEMLLNDTNTIRHCLEIGTPGTYASTIKDRIKGTIYALTDRPAINDILQARSFNPFNGFKGYNNHVSLNDYQPIGSEIPDNTIDLIICTIGLHHCPPSKLEAFINSIKRVLRPGGIFLLREHNAHSPELIALAYAAHSIYNAIIPQESVDAEMNEMRNFHSLAYWKELLEHQGFSISPEEYLQDGDTTLNTFIKCTKKCVTSQDQIMSASLRALQHSEYVRSSEQTYLTAPEWNNVDASQQYGTYISSTPFFMNFPIWHMLKPIGKYFLTPGNVLHKKKVAIFKCYYRQMLFLIMHS